MVEQETVMKCDFCNKESEEVVNCRQDTNFVDDDRNFVNACPSCRIENDKYWAEKWQEYYEGCL